MRRNREGPIIAFIKPATLKVVPSRQILLLILYFSKTMRALTENDEMDPTASLVLSASRFAINQLKELMIGKGRSILGGNDTNIKKLRVLLDQMEAHLLDSASSWPQDERLRTWQRIIRGLITEAQEAFAAHDRAIRRPKRGNFIMRPFRRMLAKRKLSEKYLEIHERLQELHKDSLLLANPRSEARLSFINFKEVFIYCSGSAVILAVIKIVKR
jgi:hypothetical protein